jgi:hypothetical protein
VVNADAKTFRNLLRQTNVGMLPEGLAAMTRGATPSKEAVYILKRKGFVRIAIQVGADYPVSYFGPVMMGIRTSCASPQCLLHMHASSGNLKTTAICISCAGLRFMH